MNRVRIGLGSCGVAAGARDVRDAIARELSDRKIDAQVVGTGCVGLCHREVLVEIESPIGTCLYGNVTVESVPGLLATQLGEQRAYAELLIWHQGHSKQPAFLARQQRIVLNNCGRIDPESIDDYRSHGGYEALERVLGKMSPEAVIDEILTAGLRGRGGGGFSTGKKWGHARAAAGDQKYLVCNADEGDPGAFMDRNIIEGDPFAVVEGMTIAAYAIGASEGFVYVRAEYPLAGERIEWACQKARERGYLGNEIAGSEFSFDVQIRRGGGAFVCGEETALIASLEGRRGIPRRRPPFPVEKGLWGKPTLINNVETYANVPWIIVNGSAAFHRHGTSHSAGTKVFSLAGKINRAGLVEVPMGITLREIIEDIGGGSKTKHPIKAVQIGGPAGGCLPAHLFDTPVDYESLVRTGAIMGSGGLVALDESRCMVDVARFFLGFAQAESCGKCTFCRVGTKRMLETMDRICSGHSADLDELEQLAHQVQHNSLCGLGKAAPNAVLTTLRYFREEYEAHLHRKCCPAGVCRDLITFEIDSYKCDGCTLCSLQCPTEAIVRHGSIIPLEITAVDCTRCGGCYETCEFGAVILVQNQQVAT